MRVLQDAGDACLWASSVMIVAWVIQYSVLAPWWDNPIGITIINQRDNDTIWTTFYGAGNVCLSFFTFSAAKVKGPFSSRIIS